MSLILERIKVVENACPEMGIHTDLGRVVFNLRFLQVKYRLCECRLSNT